MPNFSYTEAVTNKPKKTVIIEILLQEEKIIGKSQRTFGTFASPNPLADASACKRAKSYRRTRKKMTGRHRLADLKSIFDKIR